MPSNKLIDRVMNRLTPGRARLAVLIYGLRLYTTRYNYAYDRLHNRINFRCFFDAFFKPEKSVWMTLLFPAELLYPLGLSPIIMESVGGILGALGLTRSFLKNTIEKGIPSSLCTFHRAHLSLALKNGLYPPAFVTAVSALCDGNLRSLQEVSEFFPSPFFFIDIPEPDTPGAQEFLASQLEELYSRLAFSRRVPNSVDRLKRAVELAEETRIWMNKVNKLRAERYFPDQPPMSFAWNVLNQTAHLGCEDGRDFYKTLYHDLETEGKPIPENVLRFLVLHLPPTYKHPAIDTIAQKNGMVVMEEFNTNSWPPLDPEDPFGSIAERLLSFHLIGPPERRIRHINQLVEQYSADGILSFSHWGCRHSSGSIHMMKEKFNAPCLPLETDLVDSESASEGQIKTRIESFIEMLDSRQEV